MADGFDGLVDDATAFFAELRENNRKDWFEPLKDRYVREIRKPAELLGGDFEQDLGALTRVSHTPKLIRVYRNTRSSKDKTPCNAHLHLSWFPTAAAPGPACSSGPRPTISLSAPAFRARACQDLARLKAGVDARGDALRDALHKAREETGAQLPEFGPTMLERVPKPFAPHHPHSCRSGAGSTKS